MIVAIFTDNDLQDWCEKCVFGSDSTIENTRELTDEGRAQAWQTLGLPVSRLLPLLTALNYPTPSEFAAGWRNGKIRGKQTDITH